jgi:hypothetical protein
MEEWHKEEEHQQSQFHADILLADRLGRVNA